MITQVDEALKAAVRAALHSPDVEVVLDAPTKDWAARRNAPTIDLYLYDLREDLRRRSRGLIEQRSDDGTVLRRFAPPRIYRLSYLVTAWTQRPEDEHRLLDSVLQHLAIHEALPGYELATMMVGLPPAEDRGFADVWTALGGELKPSIDVVVVVPADVDASRQIAPPVKEGMLLDVGGAPGSSGGAEESGVRRHVPVPASAEVPAPRARSRKAPRQ